MSAHQHLQHCALQHTVPQSVTNLAENLCILELEKAAAAAATGIVGYIPASVLLVRQMSEQKVLLLSSNLVVLVEFW